MREESFPFKAEMTCILKDWSIPEMRGIKLKTEAFGGLHNPHYI